MQWRSPPHLPSHPPSRPPTPPAQAPTPGPPRHPPSRPPTPPACPLQLGFIRSWSAYPPYVQQHGRQATDQLLARFESDMVAALGVPDAHTPVQAVMAVDMILARLPLPLES